MENFYECVLLKHGVAWGAGAGIFLITLLLAARGIIGFFLSFILMLVALGASMAIEHQGQTIGFWNKFLPESLQIEDGTQPAETEAAANASALPSGGESVAPPPTSSHRRVTSPSSQTSRNQDLNIRGQSQKQRQRVDTFTPP